MSTTPRNQIICGDCVEVMHQFPAKSIDAIVTGPPYCAGGISEIERTRAKGQGITRERLRKLGWFMGDNMGTAGLSWLLRSVAGEATRVLKPTGSLLVFCDWRMLAAIEPAIESAGLRFQNLLVWNKKRPGFGHGFRCQHELVMHFTNGNPKYYARAVGNVLDVDRVAPLQRYHLAETPVGLLERLIEVTCPPKGLVLDAFGGSGSTAIAALNTGRDWLCIEKDSKFVKIAERRIKAHQKQKR